ncbi:MAG: cytidylate kinase [Halieaceae bacterium MED-G27]|nr:cytidylate kinase [Halieaceae bacterium]OUT65816.1 MAG: cytidylate kinase [Cellvibrionales bacterium TMED21]PDH38704.1 MAG: cytidylate kinase [Halieaceae bacterium MED-G27]|tara:strand:+ start:7561 stop:8238 length:678 start_codon:yes stop_codon:yes gene_type:complete
MQLVPVICVDGPSGAGKGSLARRLADRLGFHLLDSGALYRVVGHVASERGVAWDDELGLEAIAASLDVTFEPIDDGVGVFHEGTDVSIPIRSVRGGEGASAVAVFPKVRQALLARQRELAVAPGLIADGRDMGSVVFPEADLKLFLEASAQARALRRQLQLQAQGDSVSLPRLLEAIEARDAKDRARSASPLRPAEDAVVIDSTELSASQVFDRAMALITSRGIV